MRKLFFVFSIIPFFCLAMNDNLPQGASSEGLGNCTVTKIDLWGVSNNQAVLPFLKSNEIGLSYSSVVGLKELSIYSLAAVIPNPYFTLGLNYYKYGFDLYNENKIALSLSKSFGKRLGFAMQFDYFLTQFSQDYNNIYTKTIEIASFIKLNDGFDVGFQCFNPIPIGFNKEDEIPTILRLGLDKVFDNGLYLASEMEKDIDKDILYKFAVEYNYSQYLAFRTGINTENILYSFGLTLNYKRFRTDYFYSYNKNLGNKFGFSFSIKFR